MGLDMHLYAKKWLSSYGEDAKNSKMITDLSGLSKFATEDSPVQVSVEVMYWRKANQIHGWFVENVQGGVDDCGIYFLDEVALKDLKNICDQIIAHPDQAEKLLAPRSGFFFGSSDVDEWYMAQIMYTSKRIAEILSIQAQSQDWISFYYTSSW